MYRVSLITFALLAFLAAGDVRTAERKWAPDLLLEVKRVGPVVPSPDGTRAAFVVADAVMAGEKSEWLSQIHVAGSDGSGAFQLTRGDKSATAPRWSPDGQSIAFLSARVIDETPRLSGLHIVSVVKEADGTRTPKRLATGPVHVTGLDWAPDSSALVFSHQRTPKVFEPNDISVIRVAGGEPRPLAVTAASEVTPVYSRDGRSIAYVATDDPPTWGFTGSVRVVPAAGGAFTDLAKTFDEQPGLVGWSADGQALYVTETHGTIARLSSLPVNGGAPVLLGRTDLNVTSSRD